MQKLRGLKSNFDDFQNTYRPPIKDLRFTTTAAATATAAKYNPQVLPRSLKARSDLSDLPEFPSFPREDLRERRRQGQNVGSTFRFSSAAEPSVRAALTLAGDDVKKLYVRDPYHSVTATATVTASPDVQGKSSTTLQRTTSGDGRGATTEVILDRRFTARDDAEAWLSTRYRVTTPDGLDRNRDVQKLWISCDLLT